MSAEIVGEILTNNLEIKRFYLPGVVIKCSCPDCGSQFEVDMSVHYISYPNLNEVSTIYFCCPNENCGSSVRGLQLDVIIKAQFSLIGDIKKQ